MSWYLGNRVSFLEMDDDLFVSATDLAELEVDFNEEFYCFCKSTVSDELICCEGTNCAIKFFHKTCFPLQDENVSFICSQCQGKEYPLNKENISGAGKRSHEHRKPIEELSSPDTQLSLDDAKNSATNIFCTAVQQLVKDPISKVNNACKEAMQQLNVCLRPASPHVHNLCSQVIVEIWPAIIESDHKALLNSKMEAKTAKFHTLCLMPTVRGSVETLLQSVSVKETPFLNLVIQFLLTKIFQILINKKTKQKADEEFERITKLAPREEQVLRYTAGYVCRKLLRHFKRWPKNETAKVCADILQCFHHSSFTKDYNFLTYTKLWNEKISRGGIFEISDDFSFFLDEWSWL